MSQQQSKSERVCHGLPEKKNQEAEYSEYMTQFQYHAKEKALKKISQNYNLYDPY